MLPSRKVMERIGAAIRALAFLFAFGGAGAGALYLIGSAIRDGGQAQDWARVPAQMIKYDASGIQYRYRVAGSEHIGGKVGVGWWDSPVDNELQERIAAALRAEKSITVRVDPYDPARSALDPRIPWTVIAILAPLALAFCGVGVGATYVFFYVLFRSDKEGERGPDPGERPALARTSFLGDVARFWVFSFFWNLIAFYAALTWVPGFVSRGQWLGLLVLILPAIGLVALWVCVRRTWRAIRRGPASLVFLEPAPRMGRPISGYIVFPRGVNPGDRFRVRLLVEWTPRRKDIATITYWYTDLKTEAIAAADGLRVNFYFDVPGRVPNGSAQDVPLQWRLELFFGQQAQEGAYSFDLEITPPVESSEGSPFNARSAA